MKKLLYLLIFIIFFLIFTFFVLPRIIDSCYKTYEKSKGPQYEIKGNRVCMESSETGLRATMKTLKGADGKTFEEIDMHHFKDKNYVYYDNRIIEKADPKTFEYIGNSYYRDKSNIFYFGKPINVDIETFQIIKNSHSYAKDKNYVYDGTIITEIKHPDTFEFIDYEYSDFFTKDTEYVYAGGKIIQGADPKTFKRFGRFYKDKNFVYGGLGIKLKNLDINNFELVEGSESYLRDDDSLYYEDEEVIGVNVSKFHIVPYQIENNGYIFRGECGTDGVTVICHGENITKGHIVNE